MRGGSFFINGVIISPPSQQVGNINISGSVSSYSVSVTEIIAGSGAFTGPITAASLQATTLSVGNIGATGTIEGNSLTLANPVGVSYGGTGLTSVPLNQLLIGNGSGNLLPLGSGPSGSVLVGNTGGAPLFVNNVSTYSMTLYGYTSSSALNTGFIAASSSISGYSHLGTGPGRFGSVAVDDALYADQSIQTLNLIAQNGTFTTNVWAKTVQAGGTVVSNSARLLGATAIPGSAPATAGKFAVQQADFAIDPLDSAPALWIRTTSGNWKSVTSSTSTGSSVTTIASATTLNLNTPTNSPITILVTGTTTSTNISNPPAAGTEVTFVAQSANWNITNGNHWSLISNFTSVANGTLRGVFDSSGNFVESYRSPGQGIRQMIFHGSNTGIGQVSNSVNGSYVDASNTITTPTILTGDLVKIYISGYIFSNNPGADAVIVVDRNGTKIAPQPAGATPQLESVSVGNLFASAGSYFEDSPTAGSTYAYKVQLYANWTAGLTALNVNPFTVEVWR